MTDTPSPVEDGKSAVAGAPGRQMSIGTKAGVFGLVGVISLGYIGFNAMLNHRQVVVPTAAAASSGDGQTYSAPPNAVLKQPPAAMPAPAADQAAFPVAPQQTPAAAPILEFSGAQVTAPLPAAPEDPGNANADLAPVSTGADNSPLADRLKATVLSGETASVLQNPDMVITEGTLIPCVLQTAIDSELPGLVDCIVPIDIRGSTGSVVLLDRGTKIVGQLQSGPMQGQNRVFVDWTRAETPEHVIVELDSPGADELGRSGLPGAVDNHFLQRFGGALMLTFVQGALQAGTAVAGNSGGGSSGGGQAALGFVYAGQSNGQQVANTALQNTINIQPTLTKNQGDTVSLFVAHDLDFSGVYQLQVNGTNNGAVNGAGNGTGNVNGG
jgi:type IV secretion system protein VirB10